MMLPAPLVDSVRSGRAVLFLGSGASIGAVNGAGVAPPTGDELRDMTSQQFLAGQHSKDSLAWVAQLAIVQADLFTVQDFIADKVRGLIPAYFHRLLPTFRWRGIVTTNYDTLIEDTYRSVATALQQVVPFIANNDRVDPQINTSGNVGLIKIHGCITRTHDDSIPLILSADSYLNFRQSRQRLYGLFYEWASENNVIFVGHGGQDPDLRATLQAITREVPSRPSSYIVRPSSSAAEIALWQREGFHTLSGTLADFLEALESAIPPPLRPLAAMLTAKHPIERRFVKNESLGTDLRAFLETDALYVHDAIPIDQGTPQRFYRGFDLSWYPIRSNLDVRRSVVDPLIDRAILTSDEDRPNFSDLYLLAAEAGAGKTIVMRRVAWAAASDAGVLVLYVRPSGTMRIAPLIELHRLTNERIFLFLDNASDQADDIDHLMRAARAKKLPLTLIASARTNEWNVRCSHVERFVTETFELHYLSRSEIEKLLDLLVANDAVGENLKTRSRPEQIRQFEERAGRQLLVALHEATLGRPFEEILVDEYRNIQPPEAQALYRTICMLNRLDLPVRAGLIARVHNISFESFQTRFLHPLEHVVIAKQDESQGDMTYRARHHEIAQIVIHRVLIRAVDRYDEYVRVVRHLNRTFSSDNRAFRSMIKAKTLNEWFPNYDDVQAIFQAAEASNGRDAFLCQQMANYERIRPSGNLLLAQTLLEEARRLDPRDTTIIHTMAELARTSAEQSPNLLERRRFRTQAVSILSPLLTSRDDSQYARGTLLKLAIDELSDILDAEESSDRAIDLAIRTAEDRLGRATEGQADEHFVRLQEERLAKLLDDHARAFGALKRANASNPRDPFVASRLAQVYKRRDDPTSAVQCVETALSAHPNDRHLHYAYGRLLWDGKPRDCAMAAYHFRKCFMDGDDHIDAQFWYARAAFESNESADKSTSLRIFERLRHVPMQYEEKIRIRDVSTKDGMKVAHFGRVTRSESRYAFADMDGAGDRVFIHSDMTEKPIFDSLRPGDRVRFYLGFSFSGLQALETTKIAAS